MIKLRGTFSSNPRLAPLIDGTVKVKGIEIDFEEGHPAELHERHLRDDAYDIFEFSISHYMMTLENPSAIGKWNWAALPIFFSKALLCMNTFVNLESGVESPRDLKGKKMGVPDFSMTAALWWRAMLRELYGYHAWDTEWVVGRSLETSHSSLIGATNFNPKINISWPNKLGAIDEMLQSGALDAAYPAGEEVAINANSGKVKPIFTDGGREWVAEFVRSAGFGPVNHTVVVQKRVLEQEPWIGEALYEALEESKQESYRRDAKARSLYPRQDLAEQIDQFGEDPYASGVKANLPMLQMAAEQSVEEGLAKEVIDLPGMFWESVRGT
jgi:4,5-dihydroxyphthalate decarboxylase